MNLPPEYFGSLHGLEESVTNDAPPAARSDSDPPWVSPTITEDTDEDDTDADDDDAAEAEDEGEEKRPNDAEPRPAANHASARASPPMPTTSASVPHSLVQRQQAHPRRRKFSVAPTLAGDAISRDEERAAEKMSSIDWGGESMDLSCLLLNYADGTIWEGSSVDAAT